jgi:N-terminal domain of anti-restriction factor ArdC
MQNIERQDVYTRITAQIISYLEKGIRPWSKPWNAEHAAGRITRPLRHNGQPYSGINILSLWMCAELQDFAAPIWMTFRQASELNAHVRKGQKGSLVVFSNTITRTEHDEKTGEDAEREIPYLKGYTVFNVEQIDGLPEIYHAKPAPTLDPVARIERVDKFFAAMNATVKHGGNRAYYAQELDMSRCRTLWPSRPPKNWSPSWEARLCAPTSISVRNPAKKTPPTSHHGCRFSNPTAARFSPPPRTLNALRIISTRKPRQCCKLSRPEPYPSWSPQRECPLLSILATAIHRRRDTLPVVMDRHVMTLPQSNRSFVAVQRNPAGELPQLSTDLEAENRVRHTPGASCRGRHSA